MAQNLLGEMYLNGTGVVKDLLKAAQWFQQSAQKGNADGQYNYFLCLHNGWGVEKNPKEENKWLIQAERNGSIEAKQYIEAQKKPASASRQTDTSSKVSSTTSSEKNSDTKQKTAPNWSKKVAVNVLCFDNKNQLLYSTIKEIPINTSQEIKAVSLKGYKVTGPQSVVVSVGHLGYADPSEVKFFYKKKIFSKAE